MPTYDYECSFCSHRFEFFQGMKDETLKICPECGKAALKRLIGTGAGILFKGNGFYCTDYRSENYNKGKAKESKTKPADSKTKNKKEK
ncbi:MAG: zinc ribbon domain-containing protein [Lentisphaerae bacterium]|nr:zinc ribbon domain-containing protein [Lentisphaerota bacterium]MCP4103137.1 zinc ribbon domain-containing protein [Lentisphaerota bacterium]